MRTVFTGTVLFAMLILSVATTRTQAAQANSPQQFFTIQAPWLCVGDGFVAMVQLARPQTLFVIPIDANGIEAVQKITTTGNEVFGLQCVGSHIALRVREDGSDHFSVLPFAVNGNTIKLEQREDINWSISQNAAMPPAIQRRMNEFNTPGLLPGSGMRGDWYVQVPANNRNHVYEVHYAIAETRSRDALMTTVSVTLLEETRDRKVTKTVPLVRQRVYQRGD